jgi:prepilin-type N-terminal cleavage/methylation domain-containing protein
VLKILKNKKGLTLVELLIGMVVLGIILTAVSAILIPMMQFQARANELAEQNALLDDLANQIIYDISMAIQPGIGNVTLPDDDEMVIPIAAGGGGNVVYTIADGVIWRSQANINNPLLPGEFHLRMDEAGVRVETINLSVYNTTETIYTLTLTLENEDLKFERNYAVRPLALN